MARSDYVSGRVNEALTLVDDPLIFDGQARRPHPGEIDKICDELGDSFPLG
jgi:hypothetical protein